jgi:hypothetical protein
VQLARHLPPLIESAKRLSSEGDWRTDVAREKLKTAVGQGADRGTKNDSVEIVNGELCWGGQPFQADRVVKWQKLQWHAETNPAKPRKEADPYALPPAEAVLQILAGLDADLWSDTDSLAVPLEIYCGSRVDAGSVCEAAGAGASWPGRRSRAGSGIALPRLRRPLMLRRIGIWPSGATRTLPWIWTPCLLKLSKPWC